MVNNVIGVVNYVIAARPSLLNFVIADSHCPSPRATIPGVASAIS
jgi:energy-converting hydrogenase Eha subunit B